MKTSSKRYLDRVKKLRASLIDSVKAGNDSKANKYLARLNFFISVRRLRNISQGMPGQPWEAVTLDKVKTDIVKKGL